MQRNPSTQFVILAAASLLLTGLIGWTGWKMAYHWSESLPGCPLPKGTTVATTGGVLVPFAGFLASLAGIAKSREVEADAGVLWSLFTAIATCELIGIALVGYGYTLPILRIMYRPGP